MFDGIFLYRYNMRLKSPCEIASDMTLWFSAFPNFRKNGRICGFPLNVQKQKAFQLQGGFAPQTLFIGSRSTRSPLPTAFAKS